MAETVTTTEQAEINEANKKLFSQIATYLGQMDLGGLFTLGSDGTPGGWLWEQITNGIDSEAALMISLEQTSQFQQRYGIISELRSQAVSGQPVHVPTVAEVRQYEVSVSAVLRNAGLPAWMYDTWSDTHDLMRKGLSPSEVEARLGQAWERVRSTAPEVRDAFTRFYGLAGDAALASAFLDPARTLASLDRASRTAYTAGMGQRVGLDFNLGLAERFADKPYTEGGIVERLGQLSELNTSGIFTEGFGERDEDLTTMATGLDAVLGEGGGGTRKMERRVLERSAASKASTGGPIRTQRGVTGLGTANQ